MATMRTKKPCPACGTKSMDAWIRCRVIGCPVTSTSSFSGRVGPGNDPVLILIAVVSVLIVTILVLVPILVSHFF